MGVRVRRPSHAGARDRGTAAVRTRRRSAAGIREWNGPAAVVRHRERAIATTIDSATILHGRLGAALIGSSDDFDYSTAAPSVSTLERDLALARGRLLADGGSPPIEMSKRHTRGLSRPIRRSTESADRSRVLRCHFHIGGVASRCHSRVDPARLDCGRENRVRHRRSRLDADRGGRRMAACPRAAQYDRPHRGGSGRE